VFGIKGSFSTVNFSIRRHLAGVGIVHTGMAAEGAEVLHDAPSPDATNPVRPFPEATDTNSYREGLRKFLVDAFGETDGGEALTFLRKHQIHSLDALKDKLLKDDEFKVDQVCTINLCILLGINDLRAKLRAKEAEASLQAKDVEQKKKREADAAETAKEEAKTRTATERELAKQAAEDAEKLGKQLAEDARKLLLEVQAGDALGSSVCVQ
jgi:hypothetical protein